MSKHRSQASGGSSHTKGASSSSQANSAPPPISGIGMSNDALVFMYPLLNRLTEKGASLPFRFPDTVLYEHHFPRGWFSVEREPEAAAALRRGHKEPTPVELLRGASPFLHADVPVRRKAGHTEEGSGEHAHDQKLVLVRRVAKECDSGIIRKAFCATKAYPTMAALCVSRHPTTDAVVIRYLNDAGLADTLLSSPETCLLSKMVPSRRPQFDVLVATWTPSVYSIEHRQNRHMLHDETRTVQERGDITTPSEYQELHCSSLTAERIRDHLFQFMSHVAAIEKKYIGEIRAYFRTDHKERLWFLWCDVCRFASPRQVSGLHVTVKGGEDPTVLWDRIEREVAWRKESERERSAAALIGGSGPAQKRGEETEDTKLDRLCGTHYGRHPSFSRKAEDVDPETAAIVERQLRQLLHKAKGKTPPPGRGKTKGRTLGGVASVMSMSSTTTRTISPTEGVRDKGGKVSWMTRRYLAGTSWVEKASASDGLMPMVPLSMQPLPISMLQANTSFGNGTMISSGQPSPTNASSSHGNNSNPSSLAVSPSSRHGGGPGIGLSVDVLGEMASSVVFLQSSTLGGFATSPAFPNSPSAVDEESPSSKLGGSLHASMLGEKRRSIIKYAPRSEEARGAPSKWMKTVKAIAGGDKVVIDTPRGGAQAPGGGARQQSHPQDPEMLSASPRANSLEDSARLDGDDGEKSTRSEDFFEAIGGVKEGVDAIRPFVPAPSRLSRVRASVVLSKQADMLDISSRLEYNELKRVHSAALAELQDLLYFCSSEALRSRESVPILFDLPHGTPAVPDAIMRKIGFHLTVDDDDMDRMYLERYFFVSTELHISWAFEHLSAAVEDLCYQEELRYWQAKIMSRQLALKSDGGSGGKFPLWSGVSDPGDDGGSDPSAGAGSFRRGDDRRSIRRDNTTVTIATPTTMSLAATDAASPAPDVQHLSDSATNGVEVGKNDELQTGPGDAA